jgi:iron(III) transport system substrate-binding protein
VLDVSGAGILKSSTHQAAAQKFVAFLNSAQGQTIIAHGTSFEYPIASGVTTVQPETLFMDLQPNAITISELGDGSGAIALLNQAGLL